MLASSSDQIYSFPFLNQMVPEKFSINGENPTLSLEHQGIHPFLDDDDLILNHILYSQQQELISSFTPEVEFECANISEDQAKRVSFQEKICESSSNRSISRKKYASERHSKIHTSKGPRDRRMRLSLEIARRFFDLQDMLGFDKASKTIEWLFAKSRSAIKELKEKNLTEVRKCSYSNDNKSTDITALTKKCSVIKEKKRGKLRLVDKESRYKARARARERTRERLIHRLEQSKQDSVGNPVQNFDALQTRLQEMDSLSFCTKVGEVEENLGKKGESKTMIHSHCENEVVAMERCSDQVLFPDPDPMVMGSLSLQSMKPSLEAAGLEMLEVDEMIMFISSLQNEARTSRLDVGNESFDLRNFY